MKGQTRLILGDCVRVMCEELREGEVDLAVTSPPYHNAKKYSQWPSYDSYLLWMEEVIGGIHRVLGEGCFLCLNTSPVIEPRLSRQHQSRRRAIPFDLHPRIEKAGFVFIDDIIWQKPEGAAKNRVAGFNTNRKPLAYKPNIVTEYIMVYRKETPRLIDWNMRRKRDEIVARSLVEGEIERTNIWYMQPDTSTDHPAPFPVDLPAKLISYYSYVGDTVLDPFMGSGTTGVAAVTAERRFIGIEANEGYCAHAESRIRGEDCELLM